MKKIAFCSIKGGVGKTTTMILLARCIAKYLKQEKKGKVLVIDLDANRSSTIALLTLKKIKELDLTGKHIAGGLFFHNDSLENFIIPSIYDNLDVIAGHSKITDVNLTQRLLANRFQDTDLSAYDYIFIDLPATYYALHTMALETADKIITPVFFDYFNLEGAIQLCHKIETEFGVKRLENWKLFINRKKARETNEEQDYRRCFMEAKNENGELIFKNNFCETVIPDTTWARRAIDQRYLISNRKPFENFWLALNKLASEILETENIINVLEDF